VTDKHTRIVVEVAVTSTMLAASTSVFAWTFARFTETEGYRYCAPLIVYGTIWSMLVVFSAGVAWSLAEQARVWAAGPRPPVPPGPTPPPGQPRPGDTPRPAPGPIQPRPPRPPRTEAATEVTLVDMAPVSDITQELPRVVIDTTHWRPLVAPNVEERN